MHVLNELKPQADDLVVVPEGMVLDVPEGGFPFHIYVMKFLHQPSIIRSGGYSMGLLDRLSPNAIGAWLGFKPAEPPQPQKFVKDMNLNQVVVHPREVEPQADILSDTDLKIFRDAMKELDTTALPSDIKSTDLPKFWRYSRPTQLIHRLSGDQATVNARGGVAFYIELDAENKTFAFSYSLCHNKDNFNYGIARAISKQRFDSEDWYEVKNYDPSKGIIENIGVAICNLLYNQQADENKETVFSSLSERMKECELKQIFERI
jgi:hypothetical protein